MCDWSLDRSAARGARMALNDESPADTPAALRRQSNPGPLGKRLLVAALLILTTAVLLRAGMLAGFLRYHPAAFAPQNDGQVYWEMAGRIAEGQWVDDQPFCSAPLYPYFLGLVRIAGGGLRAVYVLQLILHLGTGALLGYLALLKLGRGAALTTLVLFFLLQEPAFFSQRLLPSTIQLVLLAALLLVAQVMVQRAGLVRAAAVGLLAGLLTLSYPPALLLLPLLLPWGWWVAARCVPAPSGGQADVSDQAVRSASVTARHVQGLTAGCVALAVGMVAILPATLHNWRACGELIPLAAHAGITFCQGNAPGADGGYTEVEGVSHQRAQMHVDAARVYARATGTSGSYRQIDRFFLLRGWDYLAKDAGRALRLTTRKVWWFLTGRNYYDYDHLRWEQRDGLAGYLVWAPLPTAWLMALAPVGLIAARGGRRFNAVDYATLILPLLIVAAFWYSPRYRLPVLPMLVLATASALTCGWRAGGVDNSEYPPRWKPGWVVVVLLAVLAGPVTGLVNVSLGFDVLARYRPQYEYNLGQLYSQIGEREAALLRLRQSDELLPDQPRVQAALVNVYLQLGRTDEAREVCQHAQATRPGNVITWLSVGKLELSVRQWRAAEQAFEQALELDSETSAAHLGLWLALSNQGRREEGAPHLARAVELAPADLLAAEEYGVWLAEQGQPEEALPWLQRVVRLVPLWPEAHLNLGMAQRALHQEADAARSFTEALRLNPDYTKARQQLALMQDGPSDPTARTTWLRRQIEDAPQEAHWYSELAGILYGRGDVPGAIEVLRQARSTAAEKRTVTLELAWLLATAGDRGLGPGEEAVTLARAALADVSDPPPEYVDVLAAALAASGEYERAVQEGQRALELARQAGNARLAELVQERLELYRAGKPYRAAVPAPSAETPP